MSQSWRVVKVGGSLFDLEDLGQRLATWHRAQPRLPTVWIAGGGAPVDLVRELYAEEPLGDEAEHWLAIDAMAITARLLADLLPGGEYCRTLAEAQAAAELGRGAVLDVLTTLQADAAGPDPLPLTWDVTSDSIAARIAHELGAAELVLLKSALPPSDSLAGWSHAGYVDRYFPIAAQSLAHVRAVNLRAEDVADWTR